MNKNHVEYEIKYKSNTICYWKIKRIRMNKTLICEKMFAHHCNTIHSSFHLKTKI